MAKGLTIDDAMAAVYAEFGCPPIDREAGEFTTQEYADRHDIPYNTASSQLKKAVKAGKLLERKISVGGKNCNGYRLVSEN